MKLTKYFSASSKRDAFLAAVEKSEKSEKVDKIETSKNVVANAKKSVQKAQAVKPVKKEQKEELYEVSPFFNQSQSFCLTGVEKLNLTRSQ